MRPMQPLKIRCDHFIRTCINIVESSPSLYLFQKATFPQQNIRQSFHTLEQTLRTFMHQRKYREISYIPEKVPYAFKTETTCAQKELRPLLQTDHRVTESCRTSRGHTVTTCLTFDLTYSLNFSLFIFSGKTRHLHRNRQNYTGSEASKK